MSKTDLAVLTAGVWLAVASALFIVTLAFHGPLAPYLADQMHSIAHATARWRIVHWIAACALSLYAMSGLIVLTAGSDLTRGFWTITSWAVLTMGAIWTLTTALAEATAIADAAALGRTEIFEAWWAFAASHGTGFAFLALAVAVIALNEAQQVQRATPRWAAWAGAGVAGASFLGWAAGMWFGIAAGNVVWVIATILMSLWTLWFGIGLARRHTAPG